jgi:hypothetical protein
MKKLQKSSCSDFDQIHKLLSAYLQTGKVLDNCESNGWVVRKNSLLIKTEEKSLITTNEAIMLEKQIIDQADSKKDKKNTQKHNKKIQRRQFDVFGENAKSPNVSS